MWESKTNANTIKIAFLKKDSLFLVFVTIIILLNILIIVNALSVFSG